MAKILALDFYWGLSVIKILKRTVALFFSAKALIPNLSNGCGLGVEAVARTTKK